MKLNIKNKNLELIKAIQNSKFEITTPIIIEFDGTPNAGKTTISEEVFKILNSLFKCTYITEKAKNCKIHDKLSPKFNLVTGTQTVIEIIEEIEAGSEIIVCERGLLDSIFWMNFHNANNKLSNEITTLMSEFYLLKEFLEYNLFAVIMQCNPEASINREKITNNYINKKRIINSKTINIYNYSIEKCYPKYNKQFSNLKIDTSTLTIQNTFDTCLYYILKFLSEN